MDNFEALSNVELREKLKSEGIGNFPVTDTTRNALIKKLRNALNGPAKPVKGRRETISVVKHSSAEESESDAELKKVNKPKTVSNRRTTIAAGAKPTKMASDPSPTSITNGVTIEKVKIPDPKPAPIAKPTIVRPKSPSRKSMAVPVVLPEPAAYFADASDDDLVAAAEAAEKQSRRKSRTSRSPSLSQSSVVTTSYKHTIEPLIEHNDDVIFVNSENSDAEFSSDMVEKVRKPSTPTTKISVADRRKTLGVGPSISTNFSSISSKPIEKPIEDTSSAYRRRYTTYTPSSTTARAVDDSEDDILNKVETPFLSDFTRRLAELKAGPLPGTETSFDYKQDYKSPKSTTTAYMSEYRSSVYSGARNDDYYRSKPVAKAQPTKPSAWSALEKKLRWPLLIILAIFVAVSVYVFLFSNY